MGIGISIFLITVGATLAFAVEVSSPVVNLDVVGAILIAVGSLSLLASLFVWGPWGPYGGQRTITRERVTSTRHDHEPL